MAGVLDVNMVTVALGDPGGDNKQIFVLKAPLAAEGGGITITAAYAHQGATLAGAGTSFTLALHKYSSAGTPAVNGTIAAAIGSATQWTAGAPQAFVVSGTAAFVQAGEWVVLQYNELNAANPTNGYVNVHYVQGRSV
jgi:hypothetical protein